MESTGYINKFYNYDNISQLVYVSLLQYANFSVSLFLTLDEYDNLDQD
jgi:hypothetical protein